MTIPAGERARRGMLLARCNFFGPEGPVVRDPEAIEVLFDSIARTADVGAVPSGTTIQWDFTDHEPWHLVLNGRATAHRGGAASPDLRLKVSLDDFVDVTAERADPRRLALRGRLRPRGDLRLLLKLGKVFN
jgi:hypothetical protein